MSRVILSVMLLITCFSSVPAFSAAEPNPGPEVINLKNGTTPLPFSHRKHQKLQSSECFHCHKADKWKIDNWGKEVAHEMCISCHDLNDKGPIKCESCHK